MEKIIYIKLKILADGMLPLKDEYGENAKYDDFNIMENMCNESFIDISKEDTIFYLSSHMANSLYNIGDGCNYITFDSIKYIKIIINDDIKSDSSKKIIFEAASNTMLMLEKKLRLITNIKISLPVCKIEIYDEEYKYLYNFGLMSNRTSGDSIRNYDENTKNLLISRLRLKITTTALENLIASNSRFKRATEFYNTSFDVEDIKIRFTLIFSTLESLFNISGENIIEKIAIYGSKILFLDEVKEKKIYRKLKDFYNKRSNYIHGNTQLEITEKNEFDLREIVREILIIYWYISISKKYNSSEQVINYIENNTKDTLDLVIKSLIDSMQITDYEKYYKKLREKLIEGDYDLLKGREIISSKNVTKKLKE